MQIFNDQDAKMIKNDCSPTPLLSRTTMIAFSSIPYQILAQNMESLSWRFLEEIKPTVNYHEFHILHYCQWIELSTVHDADNEHKAKRSMATLSKGGWAWHKGHLPVEIMYNTEMLRRSDGTFDTLPIDITPNVLLSYEIRSKNVIKLK